MILTRPEVAIPATMLATFEQRGWWSTLKMNGTYTQVTVVDGRVTDTRNRHDQQHRAWKITEDSARIWHTLPRGEFQFVAELMHSKVPGIRDIHYIHDIIKAGNISLVGKTYRERAALLLELFPKKYSSDDEWGYWIIDDHTWLARNYDRLFFAMFRQLEHGSSAHEGIVVKDPNGRLSIRSNSSWSVKCRLPHKNFAF